MSQVEFRTVPIYFATGEANDAFAPLWWGATVKDYLAQVEKLRKEAAEAALIRDLATDPEKRQMFDRIASHLTVLADQVEMAMLERKKTTGT